MFNITNASLFLVNMSRNINKLINENELSQKINKIGRNVFSYIYKNQNAMRVGIWSYLLIEASVFASEVISNANLYNLDTCQNIVCNLWRDNIENADFFSNTVEFRCNLSNPNYHPFYFLKNCMIELCNYTKSIELDREECSNFTEESKELFSTTELWNSICHKKVFRHDDIFKETIFINSCIKKLCNYINIFYIELDKNLYDLCHNINSEKINEFVLKLSKINHKLKIKIHEDNNWTSTNTIMSILSSTVINTVSVLGIINTEIVYHIIKNSTEHLNMPFRILGIRNMMTTILENIKSLTNQQVITDELLPKEGKISELFVETHTLVSELSDILDPTFSYLEYNKVVEENDIIDESKIGVISSDSLLKALLGGSHITNIQEEKSLCDSSKFIQEFIDDYKSSNLEGYDISAIQMNRLKHCLQNWQNAFCYYSNELFCKFPEPLDTNSGMLLIPNEQMNCMFSNLRELCYFLIDGLWCNWTLFLKTLPATENFFPNDTNCRWDFATLKIEENTENYQIQALGSCYNQTSFLKV